jgi:hypothetical protein
VKSLFALVFLFFSFGAMAESKDAPTIAAYDVDGYFEGSTEQSTMATQIIATQRIAENLGEIVEQVDTAAIDGSEGEDLPVGSILHNKDAQSWSEDRLTAIIEQYTMSDQTPDELEEVVQAGAILLNNELQSPNKDRKSVETTIEPNTTAQIVAASPEKLDEPLDDADWVATADIAGIDVLVRAARPSHATETLNVIELE